MGKRKKDEIAAPEPAVRRRRSEATPPQGNEDARALAAAPKLPGAGSPSVCRSTRSGLKRGEAGARVKEEHSRLIVDVNAVCTSCDQTPAAASGQADSLQPGSADRRGGGGDGGGGRGGRRGGGGGGGRGGGRRRGGGKRGQVGGPEQDDQIQQRDDRLGSVLTLHGKSCSGVADSAREAERATAPTKISSKNAAKGKEKMEEEVAHLVGYGDDAVTGTGEEECKDAHDDPIDPDDEWDWENGNQYQDWEGEEEEEEGGVQPKQDEWTGEIAISIDGEEGEADAEEGCGKARAKPSLRRATGKDKEFAALVHKAHLLCLLARGTMIDAACDSPLIQGLAMSCLPSSKAPAIAKGIAGLKATDLQPMANWFKGSFRLAEQIDGQGSAKLGGDSTGTLTTNAMDAFILQALERRTGSSEQLTAISVALCRALGLITRLVSVLDVSSIKPDAESLAASKEWNTEEDLAELGFVNFASLREPSRSSQSTPFLSSSRRGSSLRDVISRTVAAMSVTSGLSSAHGGGPSNLCGGGSVSQKDPKKREATPTREGGGASDKPGKETAAGGRGQGRGEGRGRGRGEGRGRGGGEGRGGEKSSSGAKAKNQGGGSSSRVGKDRITSNSAMALPGCGSEQGSKRSVKDVERRENSESVLNQTQQAVGGGGWKRKGDEELERELEIAMAATAAAASNRAARRDGDDGGGDVSPDSHETGGGGRLLTLDSVANRKGGVRWRLAHMLEGKAHVVKAMEAKNAADGAGTWSRKSGPICNWAEVYCPGEKDGGRWVHFDAARGAVDGADKVAGTFAGWPRPMRYVVGFIGGGAKDITRRYVLRWSAVLPHRVAEDWWDETMRPLRHREAAATSLRARSMASVAQKGQSGPNECGTSEVPRLSEQHGPKDGTMGMGQIEGKSSMDALPSAAEGDQLETAARHEVEKDARKIDSAGKTMMPVDGDNKADTAATSVGKLEGCWTDDVHAPGAGNRKDGEPANDAKGMTAEKSVLQRCSDGRHDGDQDRRSVAVEGRRSIPASRSVHNYAEGADDPSAREDMEMATRTLTEPLPTNQQAYRNHPLYALERWITKYQIIYPRHPVLGFCASFPVYPRECVKVLHTAEGWLREGRKVRAGELPAKIVKSNAGRGVMAAKASQAKEKEKDSAGGGEKKTVGLFGQWQTDEWTPPAAKDGKVPKNERGQVDVWSEKCIPPGTVHIRLPRVHQVAIRLGIDFAPAMVGFEIKGGRSVPVYDGAIICKEFEEVVLEAYAESEALRLKDQLRRRQQEAAQRWRQLLRSVAIRQRLESRYGGNGNEEEAVQRGGREAKAENIERSELQGTRNGTEHEVVEKTDAAAGGGNERQRTEEAAGSIPSELLETIVIGIEDEKRDHRRSVEVVSELTETIETGKAATALEPMHAGKVCGEPKWQQESAATGEAVLELVDDVVGEKEKRKVQTGEESVLGGRGDSKKEDQLQDIKVGAQKRQSRSSVHNGTRPRKRQQKAADADDEQHEHVFLEENESFDDETAIKTRRCLCGFQYEVEEI
ncbi:hypothetical protein CBR_g3816 [Chara braunii]|uniref:Rad4 beta-hairpin domain-containing protein n=1 Tax=Chara braunii TaxID=69332 RepID=A0A388KGH9_CHABU|nr:hypothetical protein CBR_g3816 [Chara braunii]|eukprot:GBG69118.1 hypothetical protein CBR_g3816 [Chara braunii]